MTDLISRKAAIDAVIKRDANCGIDSAKVLKALPSAQPKRGKWIPCSERLPKDDVEVFVYLFKSASPYIAWVKDYRWYTEDFEVEKEYYPTAWMPLPEPYKGGQKDE